MIVIEFLNFILTFDKFIGCGWWGGINCEKDEKQT